MRPKSMVLILIALGCGLIASIGISQVVDRSSNNDNEDVQTEPIFVAMADIGIGVELNSQNVKLEEWPVDRVPEGAITDAAQLETMSPMQRLFEGEPILIGKLADSDKMSITSQTIKKGFRVMSVKVDMASSVSYLVTPGDRVDVMAYSSGTSTVILSNIEVFAINDRVSREPDPEGSGSIQAKTISLLVTPSQATKLTAHSFKGRIILSLRRPDDDTVEGEALADLEPPAPPVATMPTFEPQFEVQENGFIMEVLEGGSAETVRRYTWDSSDELPRELTSSGGPAAVPYEDEVADDFPFPAPGSEQDDEEAGSDSEMPDTPTPNGGSSNY
jgi:Flp pilus assembly protein CpaB